MIEPHFLLFIAAVDFLPVEDFPHSSNVIGAAVAVVNVVGVFPHIHCHQWLQIFSDGVVGIGHLQDV